MVSDEVWVYTRTILAQIEFPMPASEHKPSNADSLKGKLLLAMPQMNDSRFDHAVMVMLEHNSEGAMGLIVNKPLSGIDFADLMDQLEIKVTVPEITDRPVLFGGPVEIGRGFILHSTDKLLPQSVLLGENIAVTTLMEMLDLIGNGVGPKDMLFCLGYAGWTAGQLDDEIKQNAWIFANLSHELLFQLPSEKRWDAAMALAGVNPDFLTTSAGHA